MGKGSFILYDTDLKALDYLNNTQAGKLFKAIALYRLEGTKTDLGSNAGLKILFDQIVSHIDINEDKYKATCEKKSLAMKKRWDMNRSNDTALKNSIEQGSGSSDNDNDNVNVYDNDYVNDNVACGAKRENKRKNNYYNNYKKNVPELLRDEPSYDADLFMKRAIGLKYEKRPDGVSDS